MTPEQVEAELVLFAEWHKKEYPQSRLGEPRTWDRDTSFVSDGWDARAEIAHAREAELVAENATLRERVRELERENRKLNGEGMDPLDYWSA